MAGIQDFQCPNCGSPLNAPVGERQIKCAYCGSSVVVPRELRDPAPPPPQVFSSPESQFRTDKEIATVGKVVTGVAISSVLMPLILTCVIFVFVGGILFYVFNTVKTVVDSSVNSGASIVTAIAQAVPTLAEPLIEAPTLTPAPTRTPLPTQTPTPIPVATPYKNVILRDSFKSAKSGWEVVHDSDYTLEYVKGGGYRMFVNAAGGGQVVWLSKNIKNLNIEVDLTYTAGPADGEAGLACRIKDGVGFYGFYLGMDGTYSIENYDLDKNDFTTLAEGSQDPEQLLQTGVNHLRADCAGSTLTLYLNDQPLLQATDTTYTSGGVGLAARTGSSGEAGVDVLFSNYLVKGP